MERKYPKVQGYWLYTIYVPSINKYYIGVSGCKECCQRWHKSAYLNTVLKHYFNEWDSMEKTVLIDGLNREEAFKKEDELIQELRMNDLCINKQRSGLFRTNDANAYMREYREDNTEYQEYQKQWHENNPDYNKQWREQQKQQAIQRANQQAKQRSKQNRLMKKLQQQQTQLTLFDEAS